MEILGIEFFNGNIRDLIVSVKNGGLLLVPAAPALATIRDDLVYYEALKYADIVIPDSGYLAIIWNLTNKRKLHRISGLKFINAFLADDDVKKSSDFILVDPSRKESVSNKKYLGKEGFILGTERSYVAPFYEKDRVEDPALANLIERIKPKYIIINLGGGVQEKLGAYLKRNLSYKPAILCTGAAIAFLTGEQVKIPRWADRFFVGWLFRCISSPRLFIPRYSRAFKLLGLIISHKRTSRFR